MTWHRVAKSSDLTEGMAHEVVIEHEVIAIARYQNAVFAIEGMCAHQVDHWVRAPSLTVAFVALGTAGSIYFTMETTR